MKIINNIKIDFDSDFERQYELTIECRNFNEVEEVFKKFEEAKSNCVVDCFEDLDVTVACASWRHDTKLDFIKEVKRIIAKKVESHDDSTPYSCDNPTCRKEYGGDYNGGYCSDECRE